MIYHWGRAWPSNALLFCHGTQAMYNSRICHCLLLYEHGRQNFMQPFLRPRKLLWLHTCLDCFTMKWWAESLTLMSVDYAWPLPANSSQLLCMICRPVLSVGGLPLSVMVRSCHACIKFQGNVIIYYIHADWHSVQAGTYSYQYTMFCLCVIQTECTSRACMHADWLQAMYKELTILYV